MEQIYILIITYINIIVKPLTDLLREVKKTLKTGLKEG